MYIVWGCHSLSYLKGTTNCFRSQRSITNRWLQKHTIRFNDALLTHDDYTQKTKEKEQLIHRIALCACCRHTAPAQRQPTLRQSKMHGYSNQSDTRLLNMKKIVEATAKKPVHRLTPLNQQGPSPLWRVINYDSRPLISQNITCWALTKQDFSEAFEVENL